MVTAEYSLYNNIGWMIIIENNFRCIYYIYESLTFLGIVAMIDLNIITF